MAAATLTSLLETLDSSLTSAAESLPEDPSLLQTPSGISLFDTKNELFLSYLHNLVFLILFKIRETKGGSGDPGDDDGQQQKCWDDIVKNLVTVRLYSDKGVKPLESKLRYEIDRVIQASEDAARVSAQNASTDKKSKKTRHRSKNGEDDSEGDGESSGSEDDEDNSEAEDEDVMQAAEISKAANHRNLVLPSSYSAVRESTSGAYRPPRIAPTTMPVPGDERKSRARPTKSRTLDDYIGEEVSGAPTTMPSIGSNILRSGQRTQTAKEQRENLERKAYEETNYTRLPAMSKKDKRQRENAHAGRSYGGEEWTDLGAGAERVMKDLDSGRRKTSKLDQSRKRVREEPPDAGPNGMSSFEKRRKQTMRRQKR